jgi:hypothetical protein
MSGDFGALIKLIYPRRLKATNNTIFSEDWVMDNDKNLLLQ